jgi:autotransporter-associated beta strand protein
MKKNLLSKPLLLAIVASMPAMTQLAGAAAATWTNTAGGNWSAPNNWLPNGVPGTTSDVIFGNASASSSNTNDIASEIINSLTYDWNNQLQQTTVIPSGQTLTVNSAGAANSFVLLEGSAAAAPTTTTFTPCAITGGGSLVLNGLGDIVVHEGTSSGGAAANHMATLDMSGLTNFIANVGRLLVGQANGGAIVNRPSGTLILARTNNITLSVTGSANPAVMVQDGGSNANGSTPSVLTFGQANFLNGDVMRFGGQKGNGTVNFNSAFNLPSLKIRNTDGASRASIIDIGWHYVTTAGSGNNTVAIADFSLGTVDLMADTVNLAQGNIGGAGFAGTCTATLTVSAGTFDVNTLRIGFGHATNINGIATGTFNVNSNGLFGAGGALVKVNNTMSLALTNPGSASLISGTLNLNGGSVQANSITAGGGNSTINVNAGGTLVVSNTAGSLGLPIRNFSLSDGTLTIPALNGGGVVAVSNLTVGGSANLINISSVPLIGSYPATFTLINYLTGYTAGTGPLSLGTLPPASTPYSGTLVDAGGGVIQLRLTAGPVAVLGMHWTGATDNNWNLSTFNWTFQGIATNYFDGSSPLFDDATAQTNVFLATAVSPGSITVSNNTRQYALVGSGNIAGAGSLTKKGSGTLIVANQGVDNIGNVVISSGTLQIGTNDANGAISAINITNNGALAVNRSGSLTLGAAITGTGTLTKNGNGTLILSGANSYSGTTTLSGGALQVDGTSSGAGALTTSAGTVLAGSGTVSGAITVGGQMNPGSSGVTGIFNANGGLSLNPGSTLNFDLSASAPSDPALNDSINVAGNLNLNNNQITVNFDGSTIGGFYTLFTYSGSLSGNFNPAIAGTHLTATLDTSTTNVVYLSVGGSGSDLRWASVSDSAWDTSATNWLNLSSSQPSVFYSGDSVLLDDTAGVVNGITIASGVNVSPSAITDASTNNNFTISGAGHIGGSGSLVKSGLSTLAINTANTFSGTVDVQAGTLRIGNGAALGTAVGGTTVHDGATLDLNGQSVGAEAITISGAGNGGVGALINNGPALAQGLRVLSLAGNATIGGTGLLGMNNGGGGATLTGGFDLTKVGPNQLTLQNMTTVALANIDIQQGIIEFNGLTPNMGDANATNTVEAGATLQFAQTAVVWNKQFVFNGNGSATTVNVVSGSPELAGPVILHGDCVFNVAGTSLTISSLISGDGGLIKSGASPMILTGVNTYTGNTRINAGALRLNGDGSISNSPIITIVGGGTLTVTGRVDSTFTMVSGQTLKGNGAISGQLTASAGSTVSPGLDAIGALTISNQVVLSGTNIMELNQDNGTNDVLRSSSSITYGGTLNLVNLGSALTNGASFKLFNASSYLGSFSSITPATPGPGQTWDTSALGTTGTIKVLATARPRITAISVSGTTLNLSATNGANGGQFVLLGSTNVLLPFSQWTPILTNNFDGSGNLNLSTNIINPAVPLQFYILSR